MASGEADEPVMEGEPADSEQGLSQEHEADLDQHPMRHKAQTLLKLGVKILKDHKDRKLRKQHGDYAELGPASNSYGGGFAGRARCFNNRRGQRRSIAGC